MARRKARPGDESDGSSTTSVSRSAGSRRSSSVVGDGQPALLERGEVDVQADVAEVDRRREVIGEEQVRRHRRRLGRAVRLEDAGLERARQERVVHAVEHVGERLVAGDPRQDRLVDRRAGVAAVDDLELRAVLGLEGLDDGVGEEATSRG